MAESDHVHILKCRLDPDKPLDARIIRYLKSRPRNRRGRNTKAILVAALIRYIEEEGADEVMDAVNPSPTAPPAKNGSGSKAAVASRPKDAAPSRGDATTALPDTDLVRNVTAMFGSKRAP